MREIQKTTLRFKRLREQAKQPCYGTQWAAGADLYACLDEPLTVRAGETEFVPTGLAMEIPARWSGLFMRGAVLPVKGAGPGK